MKRKLSVLLSVLLAAMFSLVIAGCNLFGDKTPPTLTLDQTAIELEVGKTAELTATCSDEDLDVSWSSSDEAVATVANGVVTAVAEGTATVTASVNDVTATCEVTVKPYVAPTLVVELNGTDDSSIDLLVGFTAELETSLMKNNADLGVAFTYTSSAPTVATVDEDGVITAVAKGTATVSYSATFEGKTYDGSVSVTVNNDVIIELSATSLDLCALEGDETYDKTGNLTATLYVNNVEADASLLSWTSDNEAVATVANGVVTGVKKGTAKISAVYTVDGESYSSYASVTVYAKKVAIEDQLVYDLYNAGETLALDGVEADGEVIDVQLSGSSVTFDNEDGLAIALEGVKAGYYTLSVFTDVCEYTASAVIADKVISTAAELDNWPSYIRPEGWALNKTNNYNGLVVLGADIDYGHKEYSNELNNYASMTQSGRFVRLVEAGKTVALSTDASLATSENAVKAGYNSIFYGIFDGLGHTIYNINFGVQNSGIFGDYMGGTVKNLALVDVNMGKTNWNGAIAGHFQGVAENIFIEGSVNRNVTRETGLFASLLTATARLSNVVCVLSAGKEVVEADNRLASVAVSDDVVLTNLKNVIGIGYNQDAICTWTLTDTLPTTKLAGYESVAEFLATDPDLSFATGYWTIENGFPVIKSAVQYINDIVPVLTIDGEVATVVQAGQDIEVIGTDFQMYAGYQLTRSNQQAYYTFTAKADGVEAALQPTVDGNVISIPEGFPGGATIEITCTSLLTGKSVTTTIKCVLNPVDLTAEGTVVNAYFSLTDATHTFTNTAITKEVKSVSNGSAAVTFTAADNGFTVTQEALLAAGVTAADFAAGKKLTLLAETDTDAYTVQVMLASFAIRTADDLRIWPSKIRPEGWTDSKANNYSGYVVLANNIDFGGAKYWHNELVHSAQLTATNQSLYRDSSLAGMKITSASYDSRFYGTFDGQGHTVSNIIFAAIHGGLFGSYFHGNVKNLGLKNAVVQNNWAGALAYRCYTGGVVENIYMEGYMWKTLTSESGMLFGLLPDARTNFKNVVVVSVQNENALVTTTALSLAGKGLVPVAKFVDCIGIGTINFALDNAGGVVVASYADAAAFTAANVNVSTFSSLYWDTSSGYPVFKTAK